MLKFIAGLLILLAQLPANAISPTNMTGWFYTISLPENRTSVVANGMQEDAFDCSLYGNFSNSVFSKLFKPKANSQWAFLESKIKDSSVTLSETLVTRPCLEWEDADSAPSMCIKYDEYEYSYTKIITKLNLTETAYLNYECNNYNRGRVRVSP